MTSCEKYFKQLPPSNNCLPLNNCPLLVRNRNNSPRAIIFILDIFSMIRLHGGNSRFPRVEDMPHFHYDLVDLGESVKVSCSITLFFLFF